MRPLRIEFGDEELVGEPVPRLPQHVRVTAASAQLEQQTPGILRQVPCEHMVIGCYHPPDATGHLAPAVPLRAPRRITRTYRAPNSGTGS